MDTKAIARDLIAIIIAAGAVWALFTQVDATIQKSAYTYLGLVFGYYFGAGSVPVLGALKK